MKRFILIAVLCFLTSWASAFELDDLRASAEAGDASAQRNLGNMYANGEGLPQDYAEAFKWTRKAAEQGYAEAQFKLALCYGVGEGVPQDYFSTYVWSNLAASSGEEKAIKLRDAIAKELSPADLGAAQQRAAKLFEEIQQKKAEE